MLRFWFTAFLLFVSSVSSSFAKQDSHKQLIDSSAITEIHFGNKKATKTVEVYISPSCLHCGQFIINELKDFVDEHGNDADIVVKFLPVSAKDIFIMKLIQNESSGDEKLYFAIYQNYIKRAIATINYIKVTDDQRKLFKGSRKDSEMIKFQVLASEFGFPSAKIVAAYPDQNMTEPFERAILLAYSAAVKKVSALLNSKELDLPLVVSGNRVLKSSFKGALD